ncbi:MAG: hypothetical protein ACW98Y_04370, partial [Candidatus Thorarchaeota archaeon]
MHRKHALSVLFIVLFVIQVAAIAAPITMNSVVSDKSDSASSSIAPTDTVQIVAAGGEDPLITNIVDNPSFEETDFAGGPSNWGYWGSSDGSVNISYQDDFFSSSHSAQIRARGYQWTSQSYIYQYLYNNPDTPHLTEGLDLDMYWKGVSVPDLVNQGPLYLRLEFYDGATYRNIYYLLIYGTSYSASNSSNTCYFLVNGTTGVWNQLIRDIDFDFSDYFGALGSYYLRYFYVYAQSPTLSTGTVELLIDDISVTNSTADEFIENGDFEGSANWNYPNQAAGYVTTTDVYSTDGSKSANLTAANNEYATYSYASLEDWYNYPRGFYPSGPGEYVLEFDWMYTDTTNGGSSQQSSFYIYFENESQGYSISYRLGRGDDFFSGTNSTNNLYIQAPGFGTRVVWNHLVIDLYDIANAANLTDGTFYDFYFDTDTSGQVNSSVSLFIDNYHLNSYPAGDPGFEA